MTKFGEGGGCAAATVALLVADMFYVRPWRAGYDFLDSQFL